MEPGYLLIVAAIGALLGAIARKRPAPYFLLLAELLVLSHSLCVAGR